MSSIHHTMPIQMIIDKHIPLLSLPLEVRGDGCGVEEGEDWEAEGIPGGLGPSAGLYLLSRM